MENNNPGNGGPTPTIPNRDIFDANKAVLPQQTTTATSMTPQVKEQILEKAVGHKKYSPKSILILIGFLFLVLLAVILAAKVLIPKIGGPKQTVITWWSLEEDSNAVTSLINEYQSQHPNVKINFQEESHQDYGVRLVNSLKKGDGPDIFEFHNSWVPSFKSYLSPSTEDFSSTFYQVVANDLKTKNGFLGIPLEYNGIALFINQDIFSSYGKTAPKTWDDLRTLAQTMTLRDSNGEIKQAGVAMGVSTNIDYWQDILALLMLQNGADLVNPNTTNGQSALTFFTNFSKIDHVWDNTLPTSTIDFENGKLAMYFGTYSDVFSIKKQNPNLRFAVVPVPQLPTNSSTIPSVSYASYWVNGVSNKSANPSIAWDFLKFISSKSSLEELHKNEIDVRGYGNLYPRVDMQSELLSDVVASPFVYQAGFARSWYLNDKTFDGSNGINTLVAKPYADAVETVNVNSTSDSALNTTKTAIARVLSVYGLVAAPLSTP